jgi:thymidylate synthase
MRIFKGNSFASVYRDLLHDLVESPQYVCSPRDQKIKEILNVGLEIESPALALYSNEVRSSQYKYIAAELIFYFGGRNDLAYIEQYAKFWKDIANPDGTVNSAYGYLLFSKKNEHGMNQWEWAFESLKKDKDTRQALMHFNLPEHQHFANKDFVCTLNGVFHIRENKLEFTVMMRSNDVVLGLPTDVAFFCMLQEQMLSLLRKEAYPDLQMGKYMHYVNSMHLYERNFKIVDDMLLRPFESQTTPAIQDDMIDEKGKMTEKMIKLHDAVVNDILDEDFHEGDGAMEWIYSKIFRSHNFAEQFKHIKLTKKK